MEINLTPKYTRRTFVYSAKKMVDVLAHEITELENTVDNLIDECNEVHEQMENYKALYEQEKAERQKLQDEITRLKEKEVRIERQTYYGRC